MVRVSFVVVSFCCAFLFSAEANAQFFRNNAIHVAAGWQGMGSTFDAIAGDPLWNIHDQATLGAGYTAALGYELWGDSGASIGLSSVRISDIEFEPMVSLNIWGGIRYNFMTERFRPFVSVAGDLLTVVTPSANIPVNALFGGVPFWAGARVGGGFEFFHLDDQSIMLDAQGVAFIGANSAPPGGIASPVLPATSVRLVYHIYF